MRPVIALAALAALAGCVPLGPRTDPTRYYVLVAEPSASPPARAAVPVLGLGPVRLAAYLDRPEVVTRAGAARIEVASVERWGAPLDALFADALAEDLRAAVPAHEVLAWPWRAGAAPEWSVFVDVLRFEREADGAGVLEARWSLRRSGTLVAQGVTTSRERGAASEVAETVSALRRTLRALARDIAAAVDASRSATRATVP